MAEQRRPFSFRLPWLPAGRSTIFNRTPPRPINQRVPLQPPASAPAQPPPPQSQEPLKNELHPSPQRQSPPPPSPSSFPPPRVLSPVPEKSESEPSTPTQTLSPSSVAASPDASPTRAEAQPQPFSQSPPHLASEHGGLTPPSPSPSAAAQPQASSNPPSPTEKLQSTAEESSRLPPSPIQTSAADASREEPTPEKFQSPPQKLQLNSSDLTEASQVSAPARGQESDFSPTSVADEKPVTEAGEDSRRTEGEKVPPESEKEEKFDGPAQEEPMQETAAEVLTAVSSIAPLTKDHPTDEVQAGGQVEGHETLHTATAAFQEQEKAEMNELSPKKPQPTEDKISEAFPEPDELMTQSSKMSDPVPAQKSPPTSTSDADEKRVAESQEDSRRTEGENAALQLKKEENINGAAHEEPIAETGAALLTEASSSDPQRKEQPVDKFEAEKTQLENHETLDKQEMLITSGSNGEQIKDALSTHPKDKEMVSESPQKPNILNEEQAPLQKEITEEILKIAQRLATRHQNQPLDGKPLFVITLAGENKGASMHTGSEPAKKEASIHIHRGYKTNQDESAGTGSDGEESSKGRRPKNLLNKDPETNTYINSNTQSINNSVVFDGSVTEISPGVQLALSYGETKEEKPGRNPESVETHKCEFDITRAQSLTYEPTVRRRSLRGLFMESSQPDPDNPRRLRRHGSQYNCSERKIDIL